MKAYLGGAMLGSSVNASVEVVGVISKQNYNNNTIPPLSNSDFIKGEGWYQVILGYGNGSYVSVDGLIYYDGTTFNGVLKGYANYYGDTYNSPVENTYITIVQYVNGKISYAPQYTIHSSGYYTMTME